MIFWNWIQIHW